MLYEMNKNIRIRICDSYVFFVNIKTNDLFGLKTNSYLYLKSKMDSGLTDTVLNSENERFKIFICELIDNGVIVKNDCG